MDPRRSSKTLSRRRFLNAVAGGIGIGAAGLSAASRLLAAPEHGAGVFSFGLVTDVHYADAPARGSRHYRDSLAKLQEAVRTFNQRKVSFVVELGDLIDAGPSKQKELEHLRTIDEVYQGFRGQRHYVLGNHCLNELTKIRNVAAPKYL